MGDRGTAVPDNPPGLVLLALSEGGVEDQQQHLTTGDQSVSQRGERESYLGRNILAVTVELAQQTSHLVNGYLVT